MSDLRLFVSDMKGDGNADYLISAFGIPPSVIFAVYGPVLGEMDLDGAEFAIDGDADSGGAFGAEVFTGYEECGRHFLGLFSPIHCLTTGLFRIQAGPVKSGRGMSAQLLVMCEARAVWKRGASRDRLGLPQLELGSPPMFTTLLYHAFGPYLHPSKVRVRARHGAFPPGEEASLLPMRIVCKSRCRSRRDAELCGPMRSDRGPRCLLGAAPFGAVVPGVRLPRS